MVVGKRGAGFGYDFWLLGKRHRKARFRTRGEAAAAEKLKREEVLSGKRKVTFAEAFEAYMAATTMAVTTREAYRKFYETNIARHLGPLFVEDVRLEALHKVKAGLPEHLGPKSVNQRLILIRSVLRFSWKSEWLAAPPHVPFEKEQRRHIETYDEWEHTQLLTGFYEHAPQWYLFFYLTCRLGLRVGEVYALTHDSFRREASKLVIDKTLERGTPERDSVLKDTRKGGDTMALEVTSDIFEAYDWHCARGFAGKRFIFCPTDVVPRYLDSYKKPLRAMQKRLGLRFVSHHRIGRHSVGMLAGEAGASLKAIQTQLGHKSSQSTLKYMHAAKGEQRKIVEQLRPAQAPHEKPN